MDKDAQIARLKLLLEWAMKKRCDDTGCADCAVRYLHRSTDWYVMMAEEAARDDG